MKKIIVIGRSVEYTFGSLSMLHAEARAMLLMDVDLRIMKHRVIAGASKDEDSLHRFAWMGSEVKFVLFVCFKQ